MTTQDKTYNGWSNYETWLVNLWLSNDQATHDALREDARCADTFYAAKEIVKQWVENELGTFIEGREVGLFPDLLISALSEVNWYEIVKHMRDEE